MTLGAWTSGCPFAEGREAEVFLLPDGAWDAFLRVVDGGLVAAAGSFDDGGGPDVALVAGDERSVDADRAGDHEALSEDLGGVAAATVTGEHAVADVAALVREEVVSARGGSRPGRRSRRRRRRGGRCSAPTRPAGRPHGPGAAGPRRSAPRACRPGSRGRRELLLRQLGLGRHDRRFVVAADGPEPPRGGVRQRRRGGGSRRPGPRAGPTGSSSGSCCRPASRAGWANGRGAGRRARRGAAAAPG